MQFENFKYRTPTDYPEDMGLAIPSNMTVDDIPDKLIELYTRFFTLGYIHQFGTACVFQASLLRRIMKLHGIPAVMQQVILYWKNDKKGYNLLVGGVRNDKEMTQTDIDLHMVVKSGDWLLDFACSPIHNIYGYTGPQGIIMPWTEKMQKNYVDLGIGGKASYVLNPLPHPNLRNWRITQRQDIIDCTNRYFERYQA